MNNIISFMHISLDGFVAGPQGQMDWIKVDPEMFNYVEQRIAETNTALYGRVTYQMMEAYWPTAADKPNATNHDKNHSKWYSQAHKVVLSNTLNAAELSNTTVINTNFVEQLQALKNNKALQGKDILLFGSPSATHALMQENLIDGYWLFVNPVILGTGIALFKDGMQKTNLHLLSSKQFSNGVVELNYLVDRK
jgi:dihydrofolate reductase